MRAILEFDPTEEQEELQTAIDSVKWKLTVYDIDNLLRQTTKHGKSILTNKEACSLEHKIAEAYREQITNLLEQYKLFLH